MSLPYWVVDAFTDRVFAGNPAAVLLPPAPLDARLMQAIAAENNLSETAFAVRGEGGWHLRWFTPTVEVDLCGHATLATAFVLHRNGEAGPFRFFTRSGALVAEANADGRVTLDFPAHDFSVVAAPAGLAEILGQTPHAVLQSADLVAVLDSADAVAALRADSAEIAKLPGGALIVTARGGPDGADITSRYFAPAYGIAEDPVTGSLHTQVVPYWAGVLGRNRLRCFQASARSGWMECTHAPPRVHITGNAVLYAQGEIRGLT